MTQRYVNTSATAGGDGSTNLETESVSLAADQAYVDLATWEAAEDGVTITEAHVVDCDRGTTAGTDNTAFTIASWSGNSATNTITIRANRDSVNGFNTTGVFDSVNFFTVEHDAVSTYHIQSNENYVILDGLQFLHDTATANRRIVSMNNNYMTTQNCYFHKASGSTGTNAYGLFAAGIDTVVTNCVFTNFNDTGDRGLYVYSSNLTYNCTFHDCSTALVLAGGINNSEVVKVRNCAIFDCGTDLIDVSTSDQVTLDYNATDDPATGFLDPRGTNGQDFNDDTALWTAGFRDHANLDLRIDSEDSLLYNLGVGNAADSNVPLLDILGNVRHSDDIGAFAYSSTEIRRFINTSAAAGGDGFTNAEATDAAGHLAYVDIATWEAAEQTALTTDDTTHLVLCDRGSTAVKETGGATISAWITGAANHITLRANRDSVNGFNTESVFNSTDFYTHSHNGTFGGGLDVSSQYVTLDGLQFEVNGGTNATLVNVENRHHFLTVQNCRFRRVASGNNSKAIESSTGSLNALRILNTTFEDYLSQTVIYARGVSTYIYNNTFYNCGTVLYLHTDINGADTYTAKNNLIFNCAVDLSDNSTAAAVLLDYNATDDPVSGTGDPRGPLGKDLDDDTALWDAAVRARASGDFRIDSEDSLLYNLGIGNGADVNVPLLDILGNVRHSDDIGAFAYSSTETRRFVNLSSAAAGNGFTNYETSAAGVTAGYPPNHHAYVDLATWEAAEQTDLVTDTVSHVVDCDMGSTTVKDTTGLTIDGWVISETYPLTVRGNRSSGTGTGFNDTGIWDPASYYTMSLVTGFYCINHLEASTTFDGIQFEIAKDASNVSCISSNTSDAVNNIIQNCIFSVVSGYSSRAALLADGNNSDWALYNNVFISIGSSTYGAIYSDSEILVYNNTFYNCSRAINLTVSVNDPVSFKNNAVFNSTTEDYLDDGIGTRDVDHNATDDPASGTAVPRGTNGKDLDNDTGGEWVASFTDHTTNDFTVKDTTAGCLIYNTGIDYATDNNVPQTDYFGNARTT